MARTVNPQEYEQKRGDILDAAQRLVFTKGYERMTIQDILAELKISSGAFYHYFATKPAVLEALIERLQHQAEPALLAIAHDPALTALQKLQRYFATVDQMRSMHPAALIMLLRGWYTDDNAIVRQKVDAATAERRAPLLTAIVCQGIQETVFACAHPDQSGEIILALLQGMSNTHARLLLSLPGEPDEQGVIAAVVATHAAYMDAIERVVGIPAASLYRVDPAAVQVWAAALRNSTK